MLLHDQMNDAVADVHVDPERLTSAARSRGGRIRRNRRLGTTIGGVAAAGILAVGLAVAVPGDDPAPSKTPVANDPSDTPSPSTGDGPPVQIDGRSTVAALRAAVLEVADGDTTAYAGQSGFPIGETERRVGEDPAGLEDTYGEFELTPASGGGPGVVGVNVQHASVLDGFPFNCTYEWMIDCEIHQLPGGDRVRTYADVPVPTAEGDGLRVVADILSPRRDLRVIASATNGFDLPNNEWDVTRPEPVLSSDQLADVVSQDWWGFKLPARFAEEGKELNPYEEIEGSL